MAIEFAYAQARAQARLGERLTPAAWQLLESSGTLAQYLHAVRSTDLQNRIRSLTAASSPHSIERSLRRDWRTEVFAAMSWVPERWRPALAWTAWLCDLPTLAWLEQGGEVLPWMADDTQVGPFAIDDRTLRQRELIAAGLGMLAGSDDVPAAWRLRFETLWPAGDPGIPRVANLVDLVDNYRREPETGRGVLVRPAQAIEARAVRMIRCNFQEAVTVLCHLLLVALDLGRLRDSLVRRALFGDWLAVA